MTAVTCRCGTTWTQIGNSTGHCANCHRTFASLDGFTIHQRIVNGRSICLDPTTITRTERDTGNKLPRFRSRTDPAGATVWHDARIMPKDAFKPKRA